MKKKAEAKTRRTSKTKAVPVTSRTQAKKNRASRPTRKTATRPRVPFLQRVAPLLAALAPATAPLRRASVYFQEETGQPLGLLAVIALLNFTAQVIFRRELVPGAFGTLNTVLGLVGLLAVPVLALQQAFTFYLAREHAPSRRKTIELLRAAAPTVVETFAWISVAFYVPLVLLALPLFGLTHFSVCFFAIPNVWNATLAVAALALCQKNNQLRFWTLLLVVSALARVIFSVGMAWWHPWTESALVVCLLAGWVLLLPLFRQTEINSTWAKTWRAVADRDFLVHLGATFSIVLALFLFSSADRIVAQSWFGSPINNNLGFVNWPEFDGYQTAGLLGRALLWGTQPLLLLFFAQRSRLRRTTAASLKFFWVYLGALLSGAILLVLLSRPLSELFCGPDFEASARLAPIFAVVMVPLGLLQALGTFALASRRYPECFVLGISSVCYAIVLYAAGRQPHLMLTYMFFSAISYIMLVLFVGIIRWGRKQP